MVTGRPTSGNSQHQRWLCVWPGLVRLWVYGDFSALLLSAGFAILLNLALLSTFVWPQWLGNHFPIVAWPLILVVWLGSWFVSSRILIDSFDPFTANDPKADALFIAAQTEYLKGNWHEAETLIVRQLRSRPRDIECRLLLATVHFQAGQFNQSWEQLLQLDKFDASSRWRFELEQLKSQVEQYLDEETAEDSNAMDDEDFDVNAVEEVAGESDDNELDVEDESDDSKDEHLKSSGEPVDDPTVLENNKAA